MLPFAKADALGKRAIPGTPLSVSPPSPSRTTPAVKLAVAEST